MTIDSAELFAQVIPTLLIAVFFSTRVWGKTHRYVRLVLVYVVGFAAFTELFLLIAVAEGAAPTVGVKIMAIVGCGLLLALLAFIIFESISPAEDQHTKDQDRGAGA